MTIDEVAFDLDRLRLIARQPAGRLAAQDIDVVFGICHRHRIAPQDTLQSAIGILEDLHRAWLLADRKR